MIVVHDTSEITGNLPLDLVTATQLRPRSALAQMLPKTSTSVSRVKLGSRKHVAIFLSPPLWPNVMLLQTRSLLVNAWGCMHFSTASLPDAFSFASPSDALFFASLVDGRRLRQGKRHFGAALPRGGGPFPQLNLAAPQGRDDERIRGERCSM